jgi:hypothetical protein
MFKISMPLDPAIGSAMVVFIILAKSFSNTFVVSNSYAKLLFYQKHLYLHTRPDDPSSPIQIPIPPTT